MALDARTNTDTGASSKTTCNFSQHFIDNQNFLVRLHLAVTGHNTHAPTGGREEGGEASKLQVSWRASDSLLEL